MNSSHFTFTDPEGVEIFVYVWRPDDTSDVKGVVQIAHGMAETAKRYEEFAKFLTENGFSVYANDHRGHGSTAKSVESLGYIGQDGFRKMVENMKQLNGIIRSEHPGYPVFLLGHSMGSFLTQHYMSDYGDSIDGAILSGSNGKPPAATGLGIYLAKREVKKFGDRHRSERMNRLIFGQYNRKFQPQQSQFDWLTRDDAEVNRYVSDPYCGAVFPASFFVDFLSALKLAHTQEKLSSIPKHLPVFIFSGDKDPVGRNGKGVRQLRDTYTNLQLQDVRMKLYPGGRHEMLNEINRDEVYQDVLAWLENHL